MRQTNGFYPHFSALIVSMIPCKPLARRLTLFVLSLFVFSSINTISAQDVEAGKAIFLSKCASCHNILQETAYPNLVDIESRHKWADHAELHEMDQ